MSHITIVMLGDGGVGKSALTVRMISGIFVSVYNPTVEDSFSTTVEVDGVMQSVNIIDTGLLH